MSSTPAPQSMKPATAAKKLGVYLPATPADFRDGVVTREELSELLTNPPQWLVDLRLHGPHPRQEVARKLGVSTSGLVRAELKDALTTDEIRALLANRPAWLEAERAVQAGVRDENVRVKARDAERREAATARGRTTAPRRPSRRG